MVIPIVIIVIIMAVPVIVVVVRIVIIIVAVIGSLPGAVVVFIVVVVVVFQDILQLVHQVLQVIVLDDDGDILGVVDDDGLQAVLRFGLPPGILRVHGQVDLAAVGKIAHLGRPVRQLLGHLLHGLAEGVVVEEDLGAVGIDSLGCNDPLHPVDTEPDLGVDLDEHRAHGQQHHLPQAHAHDAQAGRHAQHRLPAPRMLLRLLHGHHGGQLLAHGIMEVRHLEKPAPAVQDHRIAVVTFHHQIFHLSGLLSQWPSAPGGPG